MVPNQTSVHIGVGIHTEEDTKVGQLPALNAYRTSVRTFEMQIFYNHYQWLPLLLMFSALCFYLPRLLWKTIEGGTLAHVCKDMRHGDLQEVDYKEELLTQEMSLKYDVNVSKIPKKTTALGASADHDPESVTEVTTASVSFQHSKTLADVNRLLNFYRYFHAMNGFYFWKYLCCEALNILGAVLQVARLVSI